MYTVSIIVENDAQVQDILDELNELAESGKIDFVFEVKTSQG